MDDDGDGVSDTTDTCPWLAGPQTDTNGDGQGDICDMDDDGDGVIDTTDTCPLLAGPQIDTDSDGLGDICDGDDDGDGVSDTTDVCPLVAGTNNGCPPVTGAAGRMRGDGKIDLATGAGQNEFDFTVNERVSGPESGRLQVRIRERRQGRNVVARFVSKSVSSIVFTDDPAFLPGKKPPSGIDSVIFTGTGEWNGTPNHSYEVRATDMGEPGRGRDTVAIKITAPGGAVVASFGGTLSGGNVQSQKAKR